MQESDRQDRFGLGAQERTPGVVAPGRRRDPACTQDLTNGGGGHAVTEPARLALDANHTPGGVFGGEPDDQHHHMIRDRRGGRRSGGAPTSRRDAAGAAAEGTQGGGAARGGSPVRETARRGKHQTNRSTGSAVPLSPRRER